MKYHSITARDGLTTALRSGQMLVRRAQPVTSAFARVSITTKGTIVEPMPGGSQSRRSSNNSARWA